MVTSDSVESESNSLERLITEGFPDNPSLRGVVLVKGTLPNGFDVRFMPKCSIKYLGVVKPWKGDKKSQKGFCSSGEWTALQLAKAGRVYHPESAALELQKRFPGVEAKVIYPERGKSLNKNTVMRTVFSMVAFLVGKVIP